MSHTAQAQFADKLFAHINTQFFSQFDWKGSACSAFLNKYAAQPTVSFDAVQVHWKVTVAQENVTKFQTFQSVSTLDTITNHQLIDQFLYKGVYQYTQFVQPFGVVQNVILLDWGSDGTHLIYLGINAQVIFHKQFVQVPVGANQKSLIKVDIAVETWFKSAFLQESLALDCAHVNLGINAAAKIQIITTTINISTNVKIFLFFNI